jgi:hypothetical protein
MILKSVYASATLFRTQLAAHHEDAFALFRGSFILDGEQCASPLFQTSFFFEMRAKALPQPID